MLYKAKVIDNKDPEYRERLRLDKSANYDDKNSPWIEHCSPSKMQSGGLPEIGDIVYVMEENSLIFWFGISIEKYKSNVIEKNKINIYINEINW